MPDIKFNFRGQNFKATVPDAFLLRPEVEQKELLASQIKNKYETKIPKRGTDPISQEKGILDYIGLLERPSQALKTGIRESKLGGDIYSSLGGIDLTPKEGFIKGLKSGWMGEDEVRTQDFLPEDMNPLTKGILGFAGDVATDPLTYLGAGAVRSLGRGIKKTGQVTGATETLRKAGTKAAEIKVGKSQVGIPDIARMFNAPVGEGRKVKGVADQSEELFKTFESEASEELPALQRFFEQRAKETGLSTSKVEGSFRDALERPRELLKRESIDSNTGEILNEAEYGRLVTLPNEVAEELGGEGIRLLNRWEGITKGWVDQSEAFGMPITSIKNRGYFPRQLTPSGRKRIEGKEDEFGFSTDQYGDAVRIGAGYRTRRQQDLADKTVTEYNKDMAETMAAQSASLGKFPNPLDKPYEITPEALEKAPKFFQESPFVALGMRWTRQNRATQRKWFIDEITENYDNVGIQLDNTIIPEKGIGKWVTKDPEGSGYLERIRTKDGSYSSTPLIDNYDNFREVKGIDQLANPNLPGTWKFIAPKQVARQIEDQMSLMSMDPTASGSLKNFLRSYDNVQNAWKAWTLGVRPAYHTRNAVGNIANAYSITGLGSNPVEAVKVFTGAAKLQYYARFGGSQAKRNEVLKNLDDVNVKFDSPPKNIKESEWSKPNYMNTGYSMENIYKMGAQRGVQAGHYTADNIRDVERAREAIAGVGSRISRTIGAENPVVQKGFALGGTIEGNARFAVMINTLKQIKKNPKQFRWTAPNGDKVPLSEAVNNPKYTKPDIFKSQDGKLVATKRKYTKEDIDMDVAGNQVKAALFDYGDVSKFERDALKRFMPFYTWTRKNIPAQLKHLVLNPQRAEKLAIAKQQFEHQTGDLDYSDYGQFWGQRVPVFLGKENQGVIKAFTLLNVLPMADLQRIIQPGPLLAEMTSPAIKAPLEILANYDTFRGSKIAKQRFGSGESKDFLGVSLPPRLWHLSQIIVPLTEINRLNPAGVFGERAKDDRGIMQSTRAFGGVGALRESSIDAPEAARWIRFFSGGTTYDVDLGKQRYMMNKNLLKDIRDLKSAIKFAARNSQNERVQTLEALLEQVLRQEITDPMGNR